MTQGSQGRREPDPADEAHRFVTILEMAGALSPARPAQSLPRTSTSTWPMSLAELVLALVIAMIVAVNDRRADQTRE